MISISLYSPGAHATTESLDPETLSGLQNKSITPNNFLKLPYEDAKEICLSSTDDLIDIAIYNETGELCFARKNIFQKIFYEKINVLDYGSYILIVKTVINNFYNKLKIIPDTVVDNERTPAWLASFLNSQNLIKDEISA